MSKAIEPGDTVYWLSSDGSRICSRVVLHVTTKTDHDGQPEAIVVDYDDSFHVRRRWEGWYTSATDCYRAGIEQASKEVQAANRKMLALVESLQGLSEGEGKCGQ